MTYLNIRSPYLISFILWFYCGLSVLAQDNSSNPSFHFEIFKLPGGQSSNYVQAMAQDSFGFMWFGSQFGLYRWDGYQFKTYLKNPGDSTSIASNYIECMYVAKDGTLWLGHWGDGISRFDHETEAFQHYNFNRGNPESTGSNYIAAMAEDRDGHLWIGTHYGVFRLDIKTGKFKQFLHDPNDPNSLSYDKCRTLLVDSEGTVWLGTGFAWEYETGGGLNRYRPETEDFVRYLHNPKDSTSLSNSKVFELFEDSKGNFWVGTLGDGLHLMDRKSGKFQRLQRNPKDPSQLSSPILKNNSFSHIKFIFEDQDSKLWIGAWDGGIKYYDPERGYMQDYFHDENNLQSLPGKYPWLMFQSQDGTRWSCTTGAEGYVFKIKESSFDYYPSPTIGNIVYSFCETKDQKLWIGTDKSGLLQFDKRTKAQSLFDPSLLQPLVTNLDETDLNHSALQKNAVLKNVLTLAEDKEGRLWIGKYLPKGLIRLNPETGELKLYQHDPEDEKSIGNGRVTDIYKDEKDRIWIVTSKGDLNLYDAVEDHFIKYQFATLPKIEFGFEYYSLLTPAAGGKIWLAGSAIKTEQLPPVLTRFDPATGEFESINTYIIADDPVLKLERICGVQEDKLGNIWICSDTRLTRVNPKSGESMHFGASHFGSLFFKGMAMDNQQRLWLFGDKISLFDPNAGTKISFIPTFNTQFSSPFHRCVFKDSNGLIYFGGKGGFQRVDPKKFRNAASTIPPESILTDFQLLYNSDDGAEKHNQPVNILTTPDIYLRHNQNAFTLQFAALDFQHPESNRLEFKLEGYDEQWRSIGLEPKVTYVKVAPGDYTFQVRSAAHNSGWGPEKTTLIHISPPWWATWWAYTFYAIIVFGMLYAFYRIQLNRSLDKAEARRLQELDTVKTRLYTNITHEFRTPLTVILGMARQVLANPEEHFRQGLQMIIRNGNNLLSLVNQMLDLSKLESGKMALHLQQSDIINYLKYIIESLHSFPESKKVQVHFHAEEDQLLMDFDTEKIQQIITNLLSNAVKFTPEGGHVYVTIASKKAESTKSQQLIIKVRDTGQGIPESEVPYIFDRFYQVVPDSNRENTQHHEGTGIGLALVKELIKLMDGEISVKSTQGKGTEFTLLLPVKNEATLITNSTVAPPAEPILPDVTTPFNLDTLQESQQDQVGPTDQQKPNILIIEDNPDVVAYIASCLYTDYQIKVGQDGQEGIDMALKHIPDLIITDVMMPYKDGFEVCRTLKNDERTSHILIVMLTAKADMESKLEGLEEGADAYLAKPFNKEELLIRIKKLLELRAALRQYYCAMAGVTDQQEPADRSSVSAALEDAFIKKARDVVVAHLDDFNFSVDQFCKEIGLSHSQLHRKLAALTGLSASKFIRHIRLRKAKKLLRDPQLSITAVAFDTGFNDPSYFGRVFKKEFDMTPKEWQDHLEAQEVSAALKKSDNH